jgi:hypothetical protein
MSAKTGAKRHVLVAWIIYFYHEDGGNIFLRDVGAFVRKTHPCMTEDNTLHFLC